MLTTIMEWKKSYETGNTVVDSEHKEIFTLVQKVMDATFTSRKEKVNTAVDFLTSYTLKHFSHEERLMQESAYPDMQKHKAQHKAFAESVGVLVQKINASGETLQLSNEINTVVVDWLIDHVLGSDMLLTVHYRDWQKNNR